ncbi:MAG: hypothetical protein AB7D06_03530 [Pedobacter sp.]
MRLIFVTFLALIIFGTFVNESYSEVTALGADRFVIVEDLGDSSRKISYFTISGEKIVLKDMIIVRDKLDNRISENIRNIYVQTDRLKEIQN